MNITHEKSFSVPCCVKGDKADMEYWVIVSMGLRCVAAKEVIFIVPATGDFNPLDIMRIFEWLYALALKGNIAYLFIK